MSCQVYGDLASVNCFSNYVNFNVGKPCPFVVKSKLRNKSELVEKYWQINFKPQVILL